jgi:hypothetical protein
LEKTIAPTLEHRFGDYFVLWFPNSNSYSVVSASFKHLLDLYVKAPSREAFSNLLHDLPEREVAAIATQLSDYLYSCQIEQESPLCRSIAFTSQKRQIRKTYSIADTYITLHADKPNVLKAVHPALAQYEIVSAEHSTSVFDIYVDENYLNLFKDERLIMAVPKSQYHFIQGKFHLLLSNIIHNRSEDDWLGTLHASAITDEETAILFIGNSGSGKSTLCGLLAAHGYKLLADDIAPLGKTDGHIYYNPAALSIKQKSFKVLEPWFPELESIPEITFNTAKGLLKYLPCPPPSNRHYPCKAMVLVNYTPESQTVLESITVKDALETFIPDSWIHPGEVYARAFLGWLDKLEFYTLRYSDTEDMVKTVSKLFKS